MSSLEHAIDEPIQDIIERIEQRLGFGGAREPEAPVPHESPGVEDFLLDSAPVKLTGIERILCLGIRDTRPSIGITVRAGRNTKLQHLPDGSYMVIKAVAAFTNAFEHMYMHLVAAKHIVSYENDELNEAIKLVMRYALILTDLEAYHFVHVEWRQFVANELSEFTFLVTD